MKNIRILLTDRMHANIRFALTLAVWTVVALAGMLLLIVYTIRLDIAFMEANRMIKNDMIHEAIFQQVFDLEPLFLLSFPLGILANVVIAAIFGKSQERYFVNFRLAFEDFRVEWIKPRLQNLGPLARATSDFMDLMESRIRNGDTGSFKSRRTIAVNLWQAKPRVYWNDQFKFAVISGLLAAYYSALCMTLYWKAGDKIIDLSHRLTRYSFVDAPQFFLTQIQLTESFGWALVIGITVACILAGNHFVRATSNTSYACCRQLRRFLEGQTSQRILLRFGDPGRSEMDRVNEILDELEVRIAQKTQEEITKRSNPASG